MDEKKAKNDHLEGLNPAQKEAVLHISGPLLILAGAGAGKTKTTGKRREDYFMWHSLGREKKYS